MGGGRGGGGGGVRITRSAGGKDAIEMVADLKAREEMSRQTTIERQGVNATYKRGHFGGAVVIAREKYAHLCDAVTPALRKILCRHERK